MAVFDRFLIGPYGTGEQTDLEPWILPEDAFTTLENAYVWRGRVRKRFGSILMPNGDVSATAQLTSRLRIQIDTTDGSGNATGTVPGAIFKVGQMFSVSTNLLTVYQSGAQATITNISQANPGEVTTSAAHGYISGMTIFINGVTGMTEVNGNVYTITVTGASTFTIGVDTSGFGAYAANGTTLPSMLSTGSATGGYSTVTGVYDIFGAAATTDVYWYPAEPVMGLRTRETSNVNQEQLVGFDTQFSYLYGTSWARLDSSNTTAPNAGVWSGSNSDFFWTCNYIGAAGTTYLFVVNNVAQDQIQYIQDSGSTFTQLAPNLDTTGTPQILYTGRIILPFKDRLLVLNTKEGTTAAGATNYYNRCRFSQNGTPLTAATAWLEDTPGKGGYVDAPTAEAIISAQFIKDRLIVFFERSTWELAYTGNEILPFVFQKLNTELGCESGFSEIPFDNAILSVGNVGVHACNGVNVNRIDDKIPDNVFDIHNGNSGPARVYGIRDYITEMAYWAYPSSKLNPTYPNKVLAYNYKNGAWATFDDSITCFGYWQPSDDRTWATTAVAWQAYDEEWESAVQQSGSPDIVAGNQEGYTFWVSAGFTKNSAALQITNLSQTAGMITISCIDCNLEPGEYVYIENCQGITDLNETIVKVGTVATNGNSFTIDRAGPPPVDDITGTYTGGGTLTRVSQLNILTKWYNPYSQQGKNVYIGKVDFYVDKTDDGEVCVEYYPSGSEYGMVENAVSNVILGSCVLETYPLTEIPFEEKQTKLWHAHYFQTIGESIQLGFSYSTTTSAADSDIPQITTPSIVFENFVLSAMVIYASGHGRLQ